MPAALPFLMFQQENAEEALAYYTSLFEDGEILSLERYGPDGPGKPGTVFRAKFRVAGQTFMAIDSPPVHAFTFTPSFSIFVECDSEAELDRLAKSLGKDGGILMPPADYGFSRKFTWLADRFGVSWQLNLS